MSRRRHPANLAAEREAAAFAELISKREATALRRAAMAWARHDTSVGVDGRDRKGERLNRALLKAARVYAAAYRGDL